MLCVNISNETAHSDLVSKSISSYLQKVLFSFETELNTVEHLYVQPNNLGGPLIGTVHIVVVQCSSFLFKANHVCS